MLIRRLTLTAFATLFTALSSFALIANAATHATPALADQDDHAYRQHDRDHGDRGSDWNRGRGYDNRDWNRGRYDGNGDRGRWNGGDRDRGRRDYHGDRRDRDHDRDHY